MKSKQEIKDWLLQNAVNEYGKLDLSDIDFGDLTVMFNGVKATYINNSSQKATYIDNSSQKATYIDNSLQKATNNIYNNSQEATNIYNNTNAIINGKEYKVDLSDDYYTIIKKQSTRNGITIIKGVNINENKIWVYKNDFVAYHATTKLNAKEGFKRKLKGFEKNIELLETIKEQGYITRQDYHNLTGACEMGIQAYAERIGKGDSDKLTLKELQDMLKPNDYGYNMIKKWGLVE